MLNSIDFVIVFIYIIFTVVLGIVYRGKQENADDYFTSSGTMTSFFYSILVGLSIAASLFSGITFVGFTGIILKHGIGIILGIFTMPIWYFVLRYWFIPKYLGMKPSCPFDVVEKRFGSSIRTVTSSLYVMIRIGWIATLIYAPTLAFMAAAGLSDRWLWPIVIIIGFSSTLYTVYGGFKGVIVTEALQFLMIFLGIALSLYFIVIKIPVPFSEVFVFLKTTEQFKLVDFSFSPEKLFNFWPVIFGFGLALLNGYVADQICLQRYIASGNAKAATRSFGFNIVGSMVVMILLGIVALMLLAWYNFVPDENIPQNSDKIFLYFAATKLPVGIVGVLLAALLAATMSSMASGINTLSYCLTMDFRMRFGKKIDSKEQLIFAKKSGWYIGTISTICAGLVSYLGQLFEIITIIGGLLGTPVFLVILLSVTKLQVKPKILLATMVVSIVTSVVVFVSPFAATWIFPISFLIAVCFLSIISLVVFISSERNSIPQSAN